MKHLDSLRELGEIEMVISAIEEDVQTLVNSQKRSLETRAAIRDSDPDRGEAPPNAKKRRLPLDCPATFDRGDSLEFSLDTLHAVIDKHFH